MKFLTITMSALTVAAIAFVAKANIADETPAAQESAAGKFIKAAADEKKKSADDKEEVEALLAEFMQKKLDASSRILRGLMIEDYELIEKNADTLLKMSHAEKWRASNDMMYLQHSTQFRNVVDDLRQKAKKKSPDGASLAWVNVTMSCIQCHQWVRNVVLADLNIPERQ